MTDSTHIPEGWESLYRLRLLSSCEEGEPDQRFSLMKQITSSPTLQRQWALCLSLERAASHTEEDIFAPVSALASDLAWATALVKERPLASIWWREVLERCEQRWEQLHELLQYHVTLLQRGEEARRPAFGTRGEPTPVAIFEEVDMHFRSGKCHFRLTPSQIYAFRTFLPVEGYLAVLQVEEQEEGLVHQLLYPQHPDQLNMLKEGGHHLFSTRFDADGETHFLMLFSMVPFASIAPEEWPVQKDSTWSWDEQTRRQLAEYLLAHRGALTPFILEVEVSL